MSAAAAAAPWLGSVGRAEWWPVALEIPGDLGPALSNSHLILVTVDLRRTMTLEGSVYKENE